jgi:hypothetical protein
MTVGQQCAGDAGEGARQHEGQQLERRDVDPERLRDPLVLLQGQQRPTRLGLEQAPVDEARSEHEREAEVEERPVGEQPLGSVGRLAATAVGQPLGLEERLLEGEAEDQRDEREVETGDAQGGEAHEQREERSDEAGHHEGQPERHALHGQGIGGTEGTDAVEAAVTQRQLPGVADEDVEREPDDRVDAGVGGDRCRTGVVGDTPEEDVEKG